MNEKKKKKFEAPQAEVVEFRNEDVIVTSLRNGGARGDNWEGEGWTD